MSFCFPFDYGFKTTKLYKKKTKCNQDVISGFLLEFMINGGFLGSSFGLVPALFPTPILLKWALGRMRYNIFLIPQLL